MNLGSEPFSTVDLTIQNVFTQYNCDAKTIKKTIGLKYNMCEKPSYYKSKKWCNNNNLCSNCDEFFVKNLQERQPYFYTGVDEAQNDDLAEKLGCSFFRNDQYNACDNLKFTTCNYYITKKNRRHTWKLYTTFDFNFGPIDANFAHYNGATVNELRLLQKLCQSDNKHLYYDTDVGEEVLEDKDKVPKTKTKFKVYNIVCQNIDITDNED